MESNFLRLLRHAGIWAGIMLAGAAGAIAQSAGEEGHIAIEKAADLTPAEAEDIYQRLLGLMEKRYAVAKFDLAADYRGWQRYNQAPYLSAEHGKRFVNNYANSAGRDYATLKKGMQFPQGTVLVKDSFTVTAENKAFPGALFIMEKQAPGESPDTADWRYAGIFPDGSLIGDTRGFAPDKVEYCHQCHQRRAETDYVFGLPDGGE